MTEKAISHIGPKDLNWSGPCLYRSHSITLKTNYPEHMYSMYFTVHEDEKDNSC